MRLALLAMLFTEAVSSLEVGANVGHLLGFLQSTQKMFEDTSALELRM